MTLITLVEPESAIGRTAEIYEEINKAFGYLPNALKMYSGSTHLLEQWWNSVALYMHHPTIPYIPLLATITVIVSQDNKCDYCLGLNEAFLMQQGGITADQLAVTTRNPENVYLLEKDKAMFLFAIAATRTPKNITLTDISALKKLGWTESEIFDVVHYAARNVATDIVFNTFKIDRDA